MPTPRCRSPSAQPETHRTADSPAGIRTRSIRRLNPALSIPAAHSIHPIARISTHRLFERTRPKADRKSFAHLLNHLRGEIRSRHAIASVFESKLLRSPSLSISSTQRSFAPSYAATSPQQRSSQTHASCALADRGSYVSAAHRESHDAVPQSPSSATHRRAHATKNAATLLLTTESLRPQLHPFELSHTLLHLAPPQSAPAARSPAATRQTAIRSLGSAPYLSNVLEPGRPALHNIQLQSHIDRQSHLRVIVRTQQQTDRPLPQHAPATVRKLRKLRSPAAPTARAPTHHRPRDTPRSSARSFQVQPRRRKQPGVVDRSAQQRLNRSHCYFASPGYSRFSPCQHS